MTRQNGSVNLNRSIYSSKQIFPQNQDGFQPSKIQEWYCTISLPLSHSIKIRWILKKIAMVW